ncbi:MAG: NUDIX domain-containing protein [Paludibacter sp.]|nr:NUDIX domain-containing protein [Paludibacter sp.]
MNPVEYFPIVTEDGEVIGKASRTECHTGTFLLHPVIHLHVFNSQGELYLQKRAMDKDIQPGKWDTSVGGHVDYGEETVIALKREVKEELGIIDFKPTFLQRYKFVSDREAELVHSYYTIYDGTIQPDPIEISEGKFWTITDIENQLGQNVFTPNFESEYIRVIKGLKFEV